MILDGGCNENFKLTKDSQKNILESLLKRSPNNYTEYESTVNDIINNVKENRDKAVLNTQRNLIKRMWMHQISVSQRKK